MVRLHLEDKPSQQKSAVALGFFDGVHLGHRAVLGAAAAYAARHRVRACAFTFSAATVPVKQGVPLAYLYPDAQKFSLLESCGMDAVFSPSFPELCRLDGEAFCRKVLQELFQAQAVFCGGDFRFGAKAAWDISALRHYGETLGFSVHQVEPVRWEGEKISSTSIRIAIRNGEMQRAAQLLGAPYQICGTVVHGTAQGRAHAVPTINLPFAPGQLVPRYGVYVSKVYTVGGSYDAITDVGVKPTMGEGHSPAAETFLLDFSGDLYDQPCRVELLHFLRDERKFPDTAALYAQIHLDQQQCKAWLAQNCITKGSL